MTDQQQQQQQSICLLTLPLRLPITPRQLLLGRVDGTALRLAKDEDEDEDEDADAGADEGEVAAPAVHSWWNVV